MNKTFFLLLFISTPVFSKPIFIGDSLTYSLAVSAKKIKPVDALYLEGTGLSNNKLLDWQSYINEVNLKGYDNIYISLGANDAIKKEEITKYVNTGVSFVKRIKINSNTYNITWIIPPVMKNKELESDLKNTRIAIYKICHETKISCFDPSIILGDDFSFKFEEKQIRTTDGVHYTSQGAELIINNIFKGA